MPWGTLGQLGTAPMRRRGQMGMGQGQPEVPMGGPLHPQLRQMGGGGMPPVDPRAFRAPYGDRGDIQPPPPVISPDQQQQPLGQMGYDFQQGFRGQLPPPYQAAIDRYRKMRFGG